MPQGRDAGPGAGEAVRRPFAAGHSVGSRHGARGLHAGGHHPPGGVDPRPEAGDALMAKTAAVEVEAGGRLVRVSSPDRVIYEATDTTPEVTKLMVAEYFASVEDGMMRALRDRPTALERWTSGVRPGMKLATSRM